jgi:hypothetical protein
MFSAPTAIGSSILWADMNEEEANSVDARVLSNVQTALILAVNSRGLERH